MSSPLRDKLLEVVKAVAPLVGVVSVLQLLVIHAPLELYLQFLAGSALAASGMLLLFLGIDQGILPMGRFIGAELPKKGSIVLIAAVAFAVGFATTVAEPDVIVLSDQVDAASAGRISEQAVLYVIAGGVGVFTAGAIVRVIFGWSLRAIVSALFFLILLLSFLAPPDFVPLAYDAGSVTTGVLTAPVILALAAGLSSVLAGRSAISDGFGILGIGSVGAIFAVLLMGLLR